MSEDVVMSEDAVVSKKHKRAASIFTTEQIEARKQAFNRIPLPSLARKPAPMAKASSEDVTPEIPQNTSETCTQEVKLSKVGEHEPVQTQTHIGTETSMIADVDSSIEVAVQEVDQKDLSGSDLLSPSWHLVSCESASTATVCPSDSPKQDDEASDLVPPSLTKESSSALEEADHSHESQLLMENEPPSHVDLGTMPTNKELQATTPAAMSGEDGKSNDAVREVLNEQRKDNSKSSKKKKKSKKVEVPLEVLGTGEQKNYGLTPGSPIDEPTTFILEEIKPQNGQESNSNAFTANKNQDLDHQTRSISDESSSNAAVPSVHASTGKKGKAPLRGTYHGINPSYDTATRRWAGDSQYKYGYGSQGGRPGGSLKLPKHRRNRPSILHWDDSRSSGTDGTITPSLTPGLEPTGSFLPGGQNLAASTIAVVETTPPKKTQLNPTANTFVSPSKSASTADGSASAQQDNTAYPATTELPTKKEASESKSFEAPPKSFRKLSKAQKKRLAEATSRAPEASTSRTKNDHATGNGDQGGSKQQKTSQGHKEKNGDGASPAQSDAKGKNVLCEEAWPTLGQARSRANTTQSPKR
jgi:hypothetical protein